MRSCAKILLVITLSVVHAAEAQKILSDKIELGSHGVFYAPTFSAQSGVLIYQSNANVYKSWQLVERNKLGEKWSEAKPIEAINAYGMTPAAENGFQSSFVGTPCLNQKGDTLYFTANYEGSTDIYYSVKHGGEWGSPVNIGNAINTSGSEDSPSIAADGKTLYFTRMTGKNGDDKCYTIYAVKKMEDGNWSRPAALPGSINSGCVKAPRILSDNVTLVFSAKNSVSSGFDVYVSVKDILGNWSLPVAVNELNSEYDDGYVSADFVNGNAIYSVTASAELSSIHEYSPVPSLLKLQKFQKLEGVFVDSETNEFVQADVKLLMENDLVAQWQKTTQISQQLYGQKSFRLLVSASGYQRKSIPIELADQNPSNPYVVKLAKENANASAVLASNKKPGTTRKMQIDGEVNRDDEESISERTAPERESLAGSTGAEIAPAALVEKEKNMEPKQIAEIRPAGAPELIYFRFASFQLEDSTAKGLTVWSSFLNRDARRQVVVTGFTDDIGKSAYNQALSEKRAMAVKMFLIRQGIAANRIITKGAGETQPFLPNTSERNRSQNRRAEIKLQ